MVQTGVHLFAFVFLIPGSSRVIGSHHTAFKVQGGRTGLSVHVLWGQDFNCISLRNWENEIKEFLTIQRCSPPHMAGFEYENKWRVL